MQFSVGPSQDETVLRLMLQVQRLTPDSQAKFLRLLQAYLEKPVKPTNG